MSGEVDSQTSQSGRSAASSHQDNTVDFVLVWSSADPESTSEKAFKRRKVFETHLEKEGLILVHQEVKTQKLNFVKIIAPLEVLCRYAEILKIRLPIKEIPGLFELQKSPSLLSLRAINFIDRMFGVDKNIFPESKRQMTTAYMRDKNYLFDIDESNYEKCFTPAIRSRVVQYILKRKRYKDDETDNLGFGYERLITAKTYSAAYPLHDGEVTSLNCQRGLLLEHWGSIKNCLRHQPLDAIRGYFGVKIAIYYAWLGFYTRMLIIPACLGFICFIYGVATIGDDEYVREICDSTRKMCPLCDHICEYWELKSRCTHSKFTYIFDNDSTALFAFLMSIWTVVYLEFWTRYSNELSHRWDLTGFDETHQGPRPEFIARLKNSKKKHYNVVTNNLEPAVPFWGMKFPFTVFSISTMLILICTALAAVFGVICYRTALLVALSREANKHSDIYSYGLLIVNVTAAFINLLFIIVFGRVYGGLAQYLTEMEIPRTQQEYEWSYAFKLYVLQFINHYSSVFYIAYYKGNFVGTPNNYVKMFGEWRQEECGISCMPELCIQLAVIMIGKQAKNALLETVIPYIKKVYRQGRLRVSEENADVLKYRMSKDYQLLNWDSDNLTEEYLEMVIQYGFVTIFVAAFPLAPLFALLNNVIESRIDAKKLLKYYKRPVALRVKGIGVWLTIMDALAKFAVVSNAFIIAITSNFIPKFVFRYIYNPQMDKRNYGSLHGFLNHTLCQFNINDIQDALRDANQPVCSFPAYRKNYNEPNKYEFTEFHWQVWLARIIFVVAFENVVAVCFLFIRWIIPNVPGDVKDDIQREQFLTNELIIQQELLRARGVISEAQCFRKVRSQDLENVDNIDKAFFRRLLDEEDSSLTSRSGQNLNEDYDKV